MYARWAGSGLNYRGAPSRDMSLLPRLPIYSVTAQEYLWKLGKMPQWFRYSPAATATGVNHEAICHYCLEILLDRGTLERIVRKA